jgi:hypothetical protein
MICEILENRIEENSRMLRIIPANTAILDRPSPARGWWEYSFLSLTERTKRFSDYYCDSYRRTFGVGISFNFEPTSAEFATVWRMRQNADKLGVSYPLYLDVAFHLYRNARHAKRLAVPNDIFIKRAETRTWAKRFAAVVAERCYSEYGRVTRMGQFWLEMDRELPAQKAFRQRLIHLARSGRRYQYIAERFAVESKVVTQADILGVIKDPAERNEVAAAIRANSATSGLLSTEIPTMKQGDLLQTCFGLRPMLGRLAGDVCHACPHLKACELAARSLATHR